MHISELAPHHVESPREIVHPGDEIRVKILEIDSERRRLSLSAKRVEDQILPVSRARRAAEATRWRDDAVEAQRPPEAAVARRRPRPEAEVAAEAPVAGARPSRRGARWPEAPAAEARRRGAGGRAPPRRPRPRGSRAEAAEQPRRRARPTAAEPASCEPPSRRSRTDAGPAACAAQRGGGGAVRRADRRHGRRQVDGAGGARAARRGRCSRRRGRARALRGRAAARRGGRALRRRGRARRRGRPRGGRASARSRADEERAWLEGLLWPLVGARVAAWLERARAPHAAAARRRSSRCRCCSRPAWRALYDATIAVVADEQLRRERAAGARPRARRRARRAPALPGGEGAARDASWCATTAASEELERELSAVLDKLGG